MKKVLLGSTALAAAGAFASAAPAQAQIELGLGGYMEQWIGYVDQDEFRGSGVADPEGDLDAANTNADTEVWFVGSTTLDNGIRFGVNIQLEGNTEADQIDESYLFVQGSFGEILLGSENSAQYKMQYAAPDVGIGLNSGDQTAWVSFANVGGTTGTFRGAFGSTFLEPGRENDIRRLTYFTPRFSGFQVGASWGPDAQEDSNGPVDTDFDSNNQLSFGANFVESFNGIDVAVAGGYGVVDQGKSVEDSTAWSLGGNLGYAGFTVGASYGRSEDDPAVGDMTGWDAGVSYGQGPWAISATYFSGERDGNGILVGSDIDADGDNDGIAKAENTTVHVSGSYKLGPGVTLAGTVGYVEIQNDDKIGSDGNRIKDNDAWYIVVGPRLRF